MYGARFLAAILAMLTSSIFAASKGTVVYSFQGQSASDGSLPHAPIVLDLAGNLYTTTQSGGAFGFGTVTMLTPPETQNGTWSETVLHSFQGGADGSTAFGGVVFDASGNLYGATVMGGTSTGCDGGCGTIYQLKPPANFNDPWTEFVLYSFQGNTDGANPYAGMIFDQAGNLYGTTYAGGSGGCGTVFEFSPSALSGGSWNETILYSFNCGHDASNPFSVLTFGPAGSLYGTTYAGGAYGYGTVFRLSPPAVAGGAWTETVLHSFGETTTDGQYPYAGVVSDSAGNLYGTTLDGGGIASCNLMGTFCGTVFRLSPPLTGKIWSETVLYRFSGLADGGNPFATVTLDAGNIYGTTNQTHYSAGSIFKLTPPTSGSRHWTETTLHVFRINSGGGNYCHSPLTRGKHGLFYGATALGGKFQSGTVFALFP